MYNWHYLVIIFKSDLPITLYEMSCLAHQGLSAFCHRLYMGKLVPLFLLSDGMGQFVREKLEYINIYKLFK